jgi:preprotein translocase subunit SecE
MDKVINFIKDVRIELLKVSWPTRSQLVKYTLVVIGLSLAVAIFLGGIDFMLRLALDKFVLN